MDARQPGQGGVRQRFEADPGDVRLAEELGPEVRVLGAQHRRLGQEDHDLLVPQPPYRVQEAPQGGGVGMVDVVDRDDERQRPGEVEQGGEQAVGGGGGGRRREAGRGRVERVVLGSPGGRGGEREVAYDGGGLAGRGPFQPGTVDELVHHAEGQMAFDLRTGRTQQMAAPVRHMGDEGFQQGCLPAADGTADQAYPSALQPGTGVECRAQL
ncbi:hypothetical protein O3441_25930 [Streptomyces sp. WMMC897]|nr:hypothetical protein [Streptomyces sp. WMMC897]MCZ7417891.1 hypothetical protein [Streptomyces sp. WMMC897]